MKVNSQSFYWISSSIVLHVEMNSSEALNNFWSGIWIFFLRSTMLQIMDCFYVMFSSCTSLKNPLASIIIANLSKFIIFKLFLT